MKRIIRMNAKQTGVALLAALAAFAGCDDNTGSLGMGMLPPADGMEANTIVFDVKTKSVEAGAVYAKTSTGYVGRFTDENFGHYEAGFLSELNCATNYKFPAKYTETEWDGNGNATKATGTVAGDTVSNIQLNLFYSTWFGASLNACRMSVYQLNEQWLQDRQEGESYRYTDIESDRYYDASTLLGRKAYTAYDASVPDSIRNGTDDYGYPLYSPYIAFILDKEIGNRILRLNYEHPEYFKDAEAFINNVFPGIYVKCDYGDGTILYIDQISLSVILPFYAVDKETGVKLKKKVTDENGKAGEDSLYYLSTTAFASTKEVIQANQMSASSQLQDKVNETGWTYIKSPAGIFTEAELPYDEIDSRLANDTLNAVKLTFTNYYEKQDKEFGMDAPTNVLLIRKKDVKDFFENNELPDNTVTYVASHNNSGTNQYTFSNISRLVTTCINEKAKAKQEAGSAWTDEDEARWVDENKVWLIPVTITYDQNNSSMIGLQHDLSLSYARLQGGPDGDALRLEVTYSTFEN